MHDFLATLATTRSIPHTAHRLGYSPAQAAALAELLTDGQAATLAELMGDKP